MVEKLVDVEAKISLQLPSGIKEIDSRCSKSYRPVKKNKYKANWDHWDHRDGNKNKFTQNSTFANTSQPQAQASKKNKRHQGNY